MRLLFWALLATFTFALSSCSRTPETAEATSVTSAENAETKAENREKALMATNDYGEELINRLKKKGTVSAEQEAQIRKIWSGYSLDGANAEARSSILKEFREEVKESVPGLSIK